MNKTKIFFIMLTLPILLSACSSATEYPYDFVGIYDSKTRQYINMGDSQDKVEEILGRGTQSDSSTTEYDDRLSIGYDDNNNIEYIRILTSYNYQKSNPTRYELPNNINCESIVTDFIDSFPYVYESGDRTGYLVTFVEKRNDKFISLSKEDLQVKDEEYSKIWDDESLSHDEILELIAENADQNPVYEISIDYTSYDSIGILRVVRMHDFADGNFDERLHEPNSKE